MPRMTVPDVASIPPSRRNGIPRANFLEGVEKEPDSLRDIREAWMSQKIGRSVQTDVSFVIILIIKLSL
jgi:hypothetical protein